MLTRRLVASLPFALLAGTALDAAAAPDLVIPLDLSGTRPAIAVAVGDRPAELWVFDTGAGAAVIGIERARAWSLANNRSSRQPRWRRTGGRLHDPNRKCPRRRDTAAELSRRSRATPGGA